MDKSEPRREPEVFEVVTEDGITEVPIKTLSISPAWLAVKEAARLKDAAELQPHDKTDACRALGSVSLDNTN